MVASTDIKFYVHTNSNAPQLQNAYGSMINVLDACLINGINIGIVSSLTASGTTVTALFSSSHNLMQYQVIKITGASQPEFNGEHRILTVPNAQSVTFELAAAPSTMTAIGTITASLPPLGWEKPFSSSNPNGGGKAAYRSLNLLLPSRPFLRVVDELDPAYTATYAKYAKVGMVEDMVDIDTMFNQAPYDPSSPDKNWIGTGSGSSAVNGWARWYYASAEEFFNPQADSLTATTGNRNWIVVGSESCFYILPTAIPMNSDHICYGFGEFKSLIDTDASNNFLSASLSTNQAFDGFNKAQVNGIGATDTSNKVLLQRAYSQNAVSAYAENFSLGVVKSIIYSGYINYLAASPANKLTPFAPIFLKEDAGVLRGELNGVFYILQSKPLTHLYSFEEDGEYFIAINIAHTNSYRGQIMLRIG